MNSFLTSGKSLWAWRKWALNLAIVDRVDPYEIDWVLQRVANLEPLTLRLESIGDTETVAMTMPLDRLSALWLERVNDRKPVQYLLGMATWRDLELVVSPAVLIPRPETELIVEIALANISPTQKLGIWVELGTGSGAIAIALAKALPNTLIHGVDCSPAAIDIAETNAKRLGVKNTIFLQGNWWSPFNAFHSRVAMVIANPPYIPSQQLSQLQSEVVGHEPHLALDGGLDGLDAIRILVDTSCDYLQTDGILLMEVMAGQAAVVADLLTKQGSYQDIRLYKDLAGIDRFVRCSRI